MLKIICGTACLFFATQATAMFCPTNFNLINLGDSIATVEAKCGKPAFQKATKDKDETNLPQEWTYFVVQSHDAFTSEGSVKITLSFIDGNVINISSGGYSVGATTACNGNTIQVGSTMKQVIAACGKAAMIKKADSTPDTPKAITSEITEWKYESTPPATLKFTNGKLTARE